MSTALFQTVNFRDKFTLSVEYQRTKLTKKSPKIIPTNADIAFKVIMEFPIVMSHFICSG